MNYLAKSILAIPRPIKRMIALAVDACLCAIAVWLAFYLRLGEFVAITGLVIAPVLVSLVLALPIFIISGLYRAIFRYNGLLAALSLARAMLIYGLLFSGIFTFYGVNGVPRTVGLIQPMLLLILVGTSRAVVRVWLGSAYHQQLHRAALPQVLIYGAGGAGRQLASAMANSYEMRVVGFLDDDERLQGHVLNGLPIYSPADLYEVLAEINVTDVLLALPTISRQRRNNILSVLGQHKLAVRTLPSINKLAQGKVNVSDLRELEIDDLLGREPVLPNHILLTKNILGKVVVVTGAGGSIGSELCRQILLQNPSKLLLIEQSEFALYSIHHELEEKLLEQDTVIIPLLASVQDSKRMHEIMSTWRPNTVYHAAAYKHVPLVEHNPTEGIKNNVFGTINTAKAAAANGVMDFVLISTDKAVRPTNIMGASKRLAEMALQALAVNSPNIKFSMVRFGNVLGSSGSVVPKFRQQILDGGPVTITHPEVTRYFMTIPEASQLVIQAGAMAKGGDVFVLDMGQAVKIMDLAQRMIELSGLTLRNNEDPEGDIEIEITGLRPGEKLHEELLINDSPKKTLHPRIMKAHEDFISWKDLERKLNALEAVLNANDVAAIRSVMQQLVVEYTPSEDIVDWVHMEQEAST